MVKTTRNKAASGADKKARASSTYGLTEDFDQALASAAKKQALLVVAERNRQASLDQLVLSAIKAANAAATDLTTQELATAVNLMLKQLVEESVISGALPNDERVKILVRSHVRKLAPKSHTPEPG